jgi:hypothetical protein
MLLLFCMDSIEKLLALPTGNPGRIRNMRDRESMKSNISQSQKGHMRSAPVRDKEMNL